MAPEAWREMAASVQSAEDLPKLPVLRKSELAEWQAARPPFGVTERLGAMLEETALGDLLPRNG